MFTLTPPLAAYPYVQYNDDDNIVAFFESYNALAQGYVDYFNTYNLADFNSPLLAGALLDWCVDGVYGIPRPFLVVGEEGEDFGAYGLGRYGLTPFGDLEEGVGSTVTYYFVSDDVYRRVVTWNFYKGDGNALNVRWLKRRVQRFLSGVTYPDQTYDISVTFTDGNIVAITVPAANPLAATFGALVNSNVLALPFQYSISVALV